MPLNNPPAVAGASLLGLLGLMAASPQDAPAARPLPAYTPNTQSTAYVGGLLNLLDAGRVADLNALRVAVENQRVYTEAVAQNVNALRADLTALGLIKS